MSEFNTEEEGRGYRERGGKKERTRREILGGSVRLTSTFRTTSADQTT